MKKVKKGFKDLVVDYKTLLNKFTIQDRVNMAQSEEGQSILAGLTPEQLVRMFPRYYQERLPEISGFLKALTPEGRKKVESGMQIADGTASAPGGTATAQGRHLNRQRQAPDVIPTWLKKAEEETGVKVSDPSAKAQLTAEQSEVFDLLKKGKIDLDDPRVEFIKKLSEEDRKAAGVMTVKGEDGKQSIERMPSRTSQMSDEEIAKSLRTSQGTHSPRERATLDLISKREGSKDPNIIYGDVGGRAGSGWPAKKLREMGHTKPLTEMSINEVIALQKDLISITKGTLRHSPGKGTSAVGSGQMISGTLLQNLKDLGIPKEDWDKIKFDKHLQERLTLQNFKSSGIGDPNADPSTWNTRILGKQYESLDTSKGYAGLTAAEAAEIRAASSDKAAAGPITSEMIKKHRESKEAEEESNNRRILAEKSISPLPTGVSPEVSEYYNRLNPGQKQKFHEMIHKAGNGDVAAGVGKINDQYQNNPSAIQRTVTSTEGFARTSSNIQNRNGWITAQSDRNWNQCASLSKAFNPNAGPASTWKVRKDLPIEPGTMVASAGYGKGPTPQGRPGAGYHTGIAITRPDKDGNFLLLDQSAGVRAKVRRINVNDPLFKAGGIGVVEGTMKSLDALNVATKVSPEYTEVITKEIVELQKTEEARLAKVAQESALKQAGLSSNEVAEVREQQASKPNETVTQVDPKAKPEETAVPVEAEKTQTAQAVPAYAQGGKMQVNSDSIEAHALGGTRGDNSLVTDENQKPLFTMNTNKESASYDPVTQSVSVQPLTKNNPNELGSVPNAQQDTQRQDEQQPESPIANSNRIIPEDTSTAESTSVIHNSMESIQCPSFSRAVNASNFKRSGAHYDWGAANLK
jgi:hypothetical protein